MERVNHPAYYNQGNIEVIDYIEDKDFNFNLGNVIKYVSRAGYKSEEGLSRSEKALEDLKKASFYLEREIIHLESKN